MLNDYISRTQKLLQFPVPANALYDTTSLTTWINQARRQLAGEVECIRILGSATATIASRVINFSGINIGVAASTGVAGVYHVRRVNVNIGLGQKRLNPRPWEWFDLYAMNNVVPDTGVPKEWAQYGQGGSQALTGTSATGSFYVDPVPDAAYGYVCDCVCFPIDLVDDTTLEAIPFNYTDAVPYFAAYLALLSAQTNARDADAKRMFDLYEQFAGRGRQMANPSLQRWQYEQAQDPIQANKIALRVPGGPSPGGGGGAQ